MRRCSVAGARGRAITCRSVGEWRVVLCTFVSFVVRLSKPFTTKGTRSTPLRSAQGRLRFTKGDLKSFYSELNFLAQTFHTMAC